MFGFRSIQTIILFIQKPSTLVTRFVPWDVTCTLCTRSWKRLNTQPNNATKTKLIWHLSKTSKNMSYFDGKGKQNSLSQQLTWKFKTSVMWHCQNHTVLFAQWHCATSWTAWIFSHTTLRTSYLVLTFCSFSHLPCLQYSKYLIRVGFTSIFYTVPFCIYGNKTKFIGIITVRAESCSVPTFYYGMKIPTS